MMLELFLAMFLITFSCGAIGVGIFAARFGEDVRRTLGYIYVLVGLLGFIILAWLAGILPMDAPSGMALGMENLVLSVILLVSALVGTVAGLALVFIATLSPE